MRRSRTDIIEAILKVAMSGVRKTHIINEANLNYKIAQKYLEILKDEGLIKQENGFVITTEKGRAFRKIAEELKL